MPWRACSRCDTTGKTLADYRKYSISGLSTPSRKNICLSEIRKRMYVCIVPPRYEGRFGRSSPDVGRDAMDALAQDECVDAYGQVAWFWLPDAGVKFAEYLRRRWWLKSPAHQEERGAAVQPLRRECRMFRPTCTDLWAPFLFSPRGLRVRPAPGIPCALGISGRR
jgi:hypothetical protein